MPHAPQPVISSTGLFTPAERITNEELVARFNAYVALHNREHAAAIAAGTLAELTESSFEFIEKASGIGSRYVVDKAGILDPAHMAPRLRERPNNELSILAEIGVAAATDALARAGRDEGEGEAVPCAASNMPTGEGSSGA